MLAEWFRLGSRVRFAIAGSCLVVIGFGLDVMDHSMGRNGPVIPLYVTTPVGCVALMYLAGDGKWRLRLRRQP